MRVHAHRHVHVSVVHCKQHVHSAGHTATVAASWFGVWEFSIGATLPSSQPSLPHMFVDRLDRARSVCCARLAVTVAILQMSATRWAGVLTPPRSCRAWVVGNIFYSILFYSALLGGWTVVGGTVHMNTSVGLLSANHLQLRS